MVAPSQEEKTQKKERNHEKSSSDTQPPEIKQGQKVKVILMREKTKKGGWKARLATQDKSGHVINTSDIPENKKPDDTLEMRIKSVNQDGTLTFEYP